MGVLLTYFLDIKIAGGTEKDFLLYSSLIVIFEV